MTNHLEDEAPGRYLGHAAKQSLVVRVTDNDFQREVLERLGRLETKMDMLAGSEQPGRMKMAEDRLVTLASPSPRPCSGRRALSPAADRSP